MENMLHPDIPPARISIPKVAVSLSLLVTCMRRFLFDFFQRLNSSLLRRSNYPSSSLSSAFASLRSIVSKSSVNRAVKQREQGAGLDVHLPLGMNPGMPVSTTELSLTRVLIP